MIQRSGLVHSIEKLGQAKILVLGDVMLDRFIYGEVSRISPEGPVPVLNSMEMKCALGGSGNVVRNLAALGASSYLISIVGPDREAEEIRHMLAGLPGTGTFLIVDEDRKSTVKTRYVSKHQQLLRVDIETPKIIDEALERLALASLHRSIGAYEVLLISDYGKGFLSPNLLMESIHFWRKHGKRVLVDPKGLDYSIYRGASILTPNLKELGEATRMPVQGDDAVIAAANKLMVDCDLEAVLVTRSQDGMSLIESSGTVIHFRSEAREVFDVTGAGDTGIAVLAAGLASGTPLRECAEMANIAAGLVVGKAGTAVTFVKDMIYAVRHQDLSSAEAKVLDIEAAADRVQLWRRKGYKVGFVSGFFELLHPGHIQLLSHASKSCERLVVGIHSDKSILRIKGENPILHEAARSAILASLEDVDMVVVFEDDNPARVLEVLNPDVHIQRGRQISEGHAAAAAIQSGGQKVMLIDIQDELKTTDAALEVISSGNL